jgi:hypothetical protein
MIFLLLTRIFLWIVIGWLLFFVLTKLIGNKGLAILGAALILGLLTLAFFNPNASIMPVTSQILASIFQPLGGTLIFFIIGLLAINFKNKTLKQAGIPCLAIAFLIFIVSTNYYLCYQIALSSETEVINLEKKQQELNEVTANSRVPVIVLLGKDSTQRDIPNRRHVQLTNQSNNLYYTAQLYQAQRDLGNTPLVMVTAAPRFDLTPRGINPICNCPDYYQEVEDISVLLQSFGVPVGQMILDRKGVDLHTSTEAIKTTLRSRGISNTNIYMVSSALEANRATATLQRSLKDLNLRVIPRPTGFQTIQPGSPPSIRFQVEDFLPSVKAIELSSTMTREFFVSLYYFLRGWMSVDILM